MNTKTDGISSGLVAVAWRTETGYEQPFYLYHEHRPGRGVNEPLVRLSDAEAVIADELEAHWKKFVGERDDYSEELRAEITRLRVALESANQCRIELVTQVHELADHIERAACSVSDQDMQRQMLDQRLYSLCVVAQWNQNGNPFAVLPPPPVEKGKEANNA